MGRNALNVSTPTGGDQRAPARHEFTAVVRGVAAGLDTSRLKEQLGADVFTTQSDDGTLVVLADVDQAALEAAVAAGMAAVTAQASAQAAADANGLTLRQRATAALDGHAAYLALPTPALKDVVAQVAALTRGQVALIRLGLNKLDSTSGT